MIRALLRICLNSIIFSNHPTSKSHNLLSLRRGLATQVSRLIPETETHLSPSTSDFSSRSCAAALQQCIHQFDFDRGRNLHCSILKRGSCVDLFAWNILINLYVQADELNNACKLFAELPQINVVSFVTLIQGCRRAERYEEGVEFFSRLHKEGHELNTFVFTTILKFLVSMDWAGMGWCVHACAYKIGHCGDAFVATALIDAYCKCGFVDDAREVFNGIGCKDMVSWTGMVMCYAENGFFEEALQLNSEMGRVGLKPNNFSFSSALKACAGLDDIGAGKSIHGYALKVNYQVDQYVSVSLLELYTNTGSVDDALQVFQDMPEKDVISWSFMISRYSQSERSQEAINMFCQMRRAFVVPNQFTFASVLQSCATIQELDFGMQIHSLVSKAGLDVDIFVLNALMDMYSKCGDIENSMQIFTASPHKNDVTWNTVIVGHVQLGDQVSAFRLFTNMINDQLQPTQVTYSSVLCGCASSASLKPGTQVHSLAIKTVFNKNVAVVNSLIDMYAKCGNIKDAQKVFTKMNGRDVVSWNSMIQAYSLHGLGMEAVRTFESMVEGGFKPDKLTFVSLLSACCNSGLLEKGQDYFNSMVKDYGIDPCMEHFTCMVWLLGRSGHLDKAMKLIKEIPFEPSIMIWRALLGACVIHKDVELGIISAKRVLEMDPQDDSTHVLLSNIFASARRWDNAASVRKNMKKIGVKKEPGLSWIETQGIVYYFSVGETSHQDLRLIHGMLELLRKKIKLAGYAPNCSVILLDVEDDEKEKLLWVHSERLALAFGLIATPSGSPIRILKNLRICLDCHEVIKFISKIVDREIVVRDINRFHHFESGVCSCGDYW
ncbi:hypothetical protein QQ045_027822 [Rhodiola kirilowii]